MHVCLNCGERCKCGAGDHDIDYCQHQCSEATLADFLEDGISDEDHMLDHVEQMRTFHGCDQ